jgi:hypothetical protein
MSGGGVHPNSLRASIRHLVNDFTDAIVTPSVVRAHDLGQLVPREDAHISTDFSGPQPNSTLAGNLQERRW